VQRVQEDAIVSEYEPAGHMAHCPVPGTDENRPAEQSIQTPGFEPPTVLEAFPAAHSVHEVDVTKEKDPAEHDLQVDAMSMPIPVEKVPAAQLWHPPSAKARAIAVLYLPAVHKLHEVAPTAEKVPATQFEQTLAPVADEEVPP
jgi:hypothetical protein